MRLSTRIQFVKKTADRLIFGKKSVGSISSIKESSSNLIGLLLVVSFFSLLLGIYLPLFSTSKLFIFTSNISIFSGIIDLWKGGEYLLAIVVFLFSMAFPILKIHLAFKVWRTIPVNSNKYTRYVHYIDKLSRWSMTEAFVVALLVVFVKAHSFANAKTSIGLYLFLFSIICVTVALRYIKSCAMQLSTLKPSGTF